MRLHRILLEAVFEIEDKFDIFQVVELRPKDAMERIDEMVGVSLDRDRVVRVWG
ncbi:hypothetical protein HRE53_28210 (plasmid) [Acaryochloris sp. 'Moss Beach']|uniref:hypothetical protein n=1 Tax=Acaryochloris sp. 'Moss Beach' TaxID=2740837 RepID=UPI001F3C7776|nr:hypothetical protein [Acaryochloris sp. 'Moss Beach']UJB72690.1 hypothetical protein HRE53_28210 [Acaryochloris sp. 'Moss Beach']